jgi:hypothetical protein
MDNKILKRVVGRVHYYEGGWSRFDGIGDYRRVSDSLWRSLFGSGVVVDVPVKSAEVKAVPVVKDIVVEDGFINKIVLESVVEVKRGKGRPRSEVVGVRAMQKRRKASGEARSSGRPKKAL